MILPEIQGGNPASSEADITVLRSHSEQFQQLQVVQGLAADRYYMFHKLLKMKYTSRFVFHAGVPLH